MPGETRDLPILLSAAGASTGQRRAAFIVSLIVLAGFITTVPIAQVNLARFPGIILIQNTLAFVNDALTACLLFAQYAVSRSRALCALAFGYLFTALMAVSHALSFPAVFSPTGLLEGTPWLYVAWHAVLPVAIIWFALRRPDQESPGSTRNALIPIAVTSLGAVCLALASTWIITKAETWLPALVQAGRLMPASKVVVAVLLLMSLAALLMLLARKSPSMLDVWLIVVMLTWLCTISLVSFISVERFDAAWYVGRIFEVLTSTFVLFALLSETIGLYARNARAAAIERRERERRLNEMEAVLIHLSRVNELGQHVSTLIHEITQPLAAISMLAQASVKLADGSTDRLKQSLEPLAEAAANAMAIVQHLRGFISSSRPDRHIAQIPEIVEDAIRLASLGDVSAVTIRTRYHPAAKTAFCDRVQTEQVVFNLVRNAVEATGNTPCVLTIASELTAKGLIQISVADTGPGLPSGIRAKLFEPFITTKASGLGVGLSICRVIIEAHGGQLWAEDNPGGGTIFRFTLPRGPAEVTEDDKHGQA